VRTAPLAPPARALDEGRGYAELDDRTITLVSGGDARAWLHDLVTADVDTLERFASRPSLLLSPTGRIRASFHVLGLGDRDLALVQADDQRDPIAALLAPYVLSSDVTLSPSRLRLFAIPGAAEAPGWARNAWRPSVLGDGLDLLVGASDDEALDDTRARLRADGLEPVDATAVETRRIRRGEPRFPVDLDADSLPAEAGWDGPPVTDRTKGCFLGQESIAKVGDRGHPTRVVVPVVLEGSAAAGEPVVLDGATVGMLTSASGTEAIARVAWAARGGPWATGSGDPIWPR
jgi:folate-binding protein YgfZ